MAAPPSPVICWIVVNLVHYHDARLRGLAARAGARPHVIQLCDRDTFGALRCEPGEAPYSLHTIMPGVRWEDVDRSRMIPRLFAALDAIRPDVVCVNGWSFGGALAGLSWCAARGVPAIVMSESCAFDEPRVWWKEALKRRIVGLASACLVGGSAHAEYLARLGFPAHRIFRGYNAVDNDHFAAGARRARADATALRARLGLPERFFVACSRFTAKKNLGRLIEAYGRYRAHAGPSAWALVILGEGPLAADLLALRRRLDLDHHVLMPGAQDYEAMPLYYGLASAFVHASTSEQWGLVVNEAMAAGLPVVVSERCGCAPDLVRPGVNGIRVAPYSPLAIAEGLQAVAAASRAERTAMAAAGRAIVADWSPDAFGRGLLAAADAALAATERDPILLDRALLRVLRTR